MSGTVPLMHPYALLLEWTQTHLPLISTQTHTVHLDTIKVLFPPTDAQVNCFENNFKIDIKIDIKTASTCFGAITIIRERIFRSC
jgi:hypothetical protein